MVSLIPSMMFLSSTRNIHFVVTDTVGRKSGFNPITQVKYNEIPGAVYHDETVSTPGDDGLPNETLVESRYFHYYGTSDIPEGEYRVTVYSVESGEYTLEYRGFDSKGNPNNAIFKTGNLIIGQSSETVIYHLAAPLPEVTSAINLKKFKIKKDQKKGFQQTKIDIEGTIQNLNKSSIRVNEKFDFKLGGLAGYQLSLTAKQFKVLKHKHETTYRYKSKHIDIEVSSLGNFKIEIEKANVSFVSFEQLSYISLQLDQNYAAKRVEVRCKKKTCKTKTNDKSETDIEDED